MEPIRRCRFVESDGFHTCGGYAFNLHQEGIQQGDLCDRHYWQRIAHEQREVMRQLVDALKARRGSQSTAVIKACDSALAAAVPFLSED